MGSREEGTTLSVRSNTWRAEKKEKHFLWKGAVTVPGRQGVQQPFLEFLSISFWWASVLSSDYGEINWS